MPRPAPALVLVPVSTAVCPTRIVRLPPPTVLRPIRTGPHRNPTVSPKRLDAAHVTTAREPNTGLKNDEHSIQPFNRSSPVALVRPGQWAARQQAKLRPSTANT